MKKTLVENKPVAEKAVQKMVTIKILDHTGDSTLTVDSDTAVDNITKGHFEQGRWPFVNSVYFNFTAKDINDVVKLEDDKGRLKTLIENAEDPIVVMTGELQGGASIPTKEVVTKRQLSTVLNERNRAQIAVGLSKSRGKVQLQVFVSDYNGSMTRLKKHQKQIQEAIWNALNN